MILNCTCGKSWFLKDEYAKPGLQIPCKACGKPIPVQVAAPPAEPKPAQDSEARVRSLEESLKQKDSELQQAQARAHALEETLRQKDADLEQAQARAGELESKAAAADEAPQLRAQLRNAVAEKESLNAKSAAAEKEAADLKLRVTETERERGDLERALEEWRSKCDQLEKKVKEAPPVEDTKRLAKAASDSAFLVQEKDRTIAALEAQNSEYRQKIDELEEAAKGLREEILLIQQHQSLAEQKLASNEGAREIAFQTKSMIVDLEREIGYVSESMARMHDRLCRALATLTIPTDPVLESPLPTPETVRRDAPAEEAAEAAPAEEVAESEGKVSEPTPPHGIPAVQPAPAPAEPVEETAEAPLAEPEPVTEEAPAGEPIAEAEPASADAAAGEPEMAAAEFDPVPLIDSSSEGDMKIVDEPAEAEPVEEVKEEKKEEPPKKRGFFSRLFGKK